MISGDMNTAKLQDDLNEFGKNGWEVLNLFDLNAVYGKSSNVVVSLKRPLEGERAAESPPEMPEGDIESKELDY